MATYSIPPPRFGGLFLSELPPVQEGDEGEGEGEAGGGGGQREEEEEASASPLPELGAGAQTR